MASYPVDDDASLQGAVNELLSGPSGLGQNFQGFNDYQKAFVRPTFAGPFTLPGNTTLNPSWYLDIPIGNIQPINVVSGNTAEIQVTFASSQPTAPFQYGDRVQLQNVTPAFYDSGPFSSYTVFDSTTTYANLFLGQEYSWPAYTSGGNVVRNVMNEAVSADNNARVTVFGPQDQVFISSQIRLDVGYESSGNADFTVRNTIERWRGYPIQGTEDYTFAFDAIISEQDDDFSVTSGTGSVPVEAIFTTVLDNPDFGYYWYFNNIYFLNQGGLEISTNAYTEYTVLNVAPIANQPAPGNDIIYSNVTPITMTGNGSGADIDIKIYGTNIAVIYTNTDDYNNINFEVNATNDPGNGYLVGDTIRILGNQVGGSSPENDIDLRINAVTNANSCYAGNVVVGIRSMTTQVIKQ